MKKIYANGQVRYKSDKYDNVIFTCVDNRYYIQEDNEYLQHPDAIEGFWTLEAAESWYDEIKSASKIPPNPAELEDAMNLLNFKKLPSFNDMWRYTSRDIDCEVIASPDAILMKSEEGNKLYGWGSISKLISDVEHMLNTTGVQLVASIILTESSCRKSVMAAINTRHLANDIVRVKSSNVWGYAFNVKNNSDSTGDLVVQFKGKNGGPGDIYIYYDVPVKLYQRWQSAPSKGHFFWVYIRNNFKYSKLTGNKRGVLRNAVN